MNLRNCNLYQTQGLLNHCMYLMAKTRDIIHKIINLLQTRNAKIEITDHHRSWVFQQALINAIFFVLQKWFAISVEREWSFFLKQKAVVRVSNNQRKTLMFARRAEFSCASLPEFHMVHEHNFSLRWFFFYSRDALRHKRTTACSLPFALEEFLYKLHGVDKITGFTICF